MQQIVRHGIPTRLQGQWCDVVLVRGTSRPCTFDSGQAYRLELAHCRLVSIHITEETSGHASKCDPGGTCVQLAHVYSCTAEHSSVGLHKFDPTTLFLHAFAPC